MKYILSLVMLVFVVSSCGMENNNKTPTSGTTTTPVSEDIVEASDESVQVTPIDDTVYSIEGIKVWGDLGSKLDDSLKNNTQFLSCTANQIDFCIQEVGNSSGEEVLCGKYLIESNRTSCENGQIMMQAIDSLDVSLCDKISGDNNYCIQEVTTQKALSTEDASVCSTLLDNEKISCNNMVVQKLAVSQKDPKICEDIKGYDDNENFEKDFCINEVEFILEEEKRNQGVGNPAPVDDVIPADIDVENQ